MRIGAGEGAVDERDGVGEGDVDVFCRGLRVRCHQAERGADGVAIGAGVRGDQKMLPAGAIRLSSSEMLARLLMVACYLAAAAEFFLSAETFFASLALRFAHSAEEFVHAGRSIFSERSMAKVSSGTWRTPMRSRSSERMKARAVMRACEGGLLRPPRRRGRR